MIQIDRLKRRMADVGVSQSELARRVAVSQQSIHKLLHGSSRSSRQLHRIARVLGTTPAYLTGEVDDPELDAPEPPSLTPDQERWLELFDALDAGGRSALVQIAERMVTGMNTPTVNAPRQAYRGEQ